MSFGLSIFRATMPLHRFKILAKCLRFDDKAMRMARKMNDKFAPIRNMEIIIANAKSV